jgi:hypothetical protein
MIVGRGRISMDKLLSRSRMFSLLLTHSLLDYDTALQVTHNLSNNVVTCDHQRLALPLPRHVVISSLVTIISCLSCHMPSYSLSKEWRLSYGCATSQWHLSYESGGASVSTQTWKFPVHRWVIPIYGWVCKYLCLWIGLAYSCTGFIDFSSFIFFCFAAIWGGWVDVRRIVCHIIFFRLLIYPFLPCCPIITLRTYYRPPTITKFSLLWTQINLRTRFMFRHAPYRWAQAYLWMGSQVTENGTVYEWALPIHK